MQLSRTEAERLRRISQKAVVILDAGANMLLWIVVSGLAMSLIALVGSLTLVLKQATLDKILLPLVAFAAGSLATNPSLPTQIARFVNLDQLHA